ncbi:MAG: DUF2127 domain-containing protein [Terracidiphilus sp.]
MSCSLFAVFIMYPWSSDSLSRMARSRQPSRARPQSRNRLLLLIAIYKFLYALLFFAIGVGAHHLLHKDIADQIDLLARHLRFNPESRLVYFVLDKAALVNDPLLRRIGFVSDCYATVTLIEGIGLYLEKAWGEFLTLAITASFLPWEIFEIIRNVTWLKTGLLVINILVFIYLLRLVLDRARQRAKAWKR